jgi:hypothetical protein
MDKSVTIIVALVFLAALAALIWFAVRNLRGAVGNVRDAIAERRGVTGPEPEAVDSSRLNRISAERLAATEQAVPEEGAAPPQDVPVDDATRQLMAQMVAGLTAQIEHQEDLEDLRGTEACVVRLVPQVPIRDAGSPRSWLGGGLRLPHGMDWPQIDGTDACALAQISLADLPADLWDGLGPRSGWLAIIAHPESWDLRLLHLPTADVDHAPPAPVGPAYCWTQIDPRPGQPPHLPRVWPQWPVKLVAVRPGDTDPFVEGEFQGRHARYAAGYDVTDAALHPFDWPSMLALCDTLAAWMSEHLKPVDPTQPSPLDDQLAKQHARLADTDLSDEQRARIQQNIDFLPRLIEAARAAAATNSGARARAEEIIAIVRESHAEGEEFEARDAAVVVEALGAIDWTRVKRENDPDGGAGAERVAVQTLPLTRHDKDVASWVYEYDLRHADLAKRAYVAAPASLPAAQRDHYEGVWQAQAQHEMPSMGHVPMGYVHEFDPREDVTLIEIPSGHLVDWMFGDCNNLVLTMKKTDLVAGAWDKMLLQISN